ncbi:MULTISPECIES: SurA N-terminal domain-containing protein [Streptomyces]|uniref:SurA N-terminal domain-containing protein n=1 Tax=unclassified Streptomyces TaxID=2593676 RepID=UPI00087E8131|nr:MULTISPECIES: SurA N-terminal domain-containing protein [unclassified Streptomyces]MDX2728627.1 SurA N-terminal domain-containing protein [Streptomyces sp. PA03-2a]MDX3766223.1 SurA N-terminal domain-containing protein [Streptomyces sp. AK08-01B]MDX3816521.1 SurA N-terminal domain-containing protein [Streptomyces sp. AK08-01A]WSQ29161.1 SurA N-terminal domain-containing protein [Streptomyces sp. NBC_01230]SCZ04664.1 SurA N-terminal domain-containing protein [Streptomyces sp. 136MFCol5.1]
MHRRRRTALVVSAAMLVAGPLLSACGNQAHPGAAAVVGGDRIEVSTVQAQVAEVRTAQRESDQSVQLISKSGQLGRAKLHGLIFDRILDKAAADANVTVSRKEIQEMQQSAATQSGGEEQLRTTMLEQSWVAPEQIEAVLREQVQLTKLAQALGADLQQPAGQKAVGDALTAASKSLHIDVNPRFGTWDDKQTQLANYKAPWITQVTKPAQQEAAAGA